MNKKILISILLIIMTVPVFAEFDDDINISAGKFSLIFGWGLTYYPETLCRDDTIFPLLKFVYHNYDNLKNLNRHFFVEISKDNKDKNKSYKLYVFDSDQDGNDERQRIFYLKDETESIDLLVKLISDYIPAVKKSDLNSIMLYFVGTNVKDKIDAECYPNDWRGESEFVRHLSTYHITKDKYLYAVYFSQEQAQKKAQENSSHVMKKILCSKDTINNLQISEDTEFIQLLNSF